MPRMFTCLAQAVAAQDMLRSRELHGTLHLGLKRIDNTLSAHAWLSYGKIIITGAAGHNGFTELTSFGVK